MLLQETIEKTVVSQKDQFQHQERIINRDLMNKIPIQNKFAIIISGVRRSGKSTLMRSIAEKIGSFHYISFEDPRLYGFELADFERLEDVFNKINGKTNYYFFDEIQLVDKWEFYVRKLSDQHKYVIITGSNASLLSKELGTKLTGRNLRYELYPFSYKEFLTYLNKKEGLESFSHYLVQGGFPEYLLLKDPKILRSLVGDSLFRDIAVRHKIRNVQQLNELAIYLISNVAKEFSYNSLRKMFNFGSTNSVSKFISFLEESYLLSSLPKFDYSLRKQIANPKKIYGIDTGLIVNNSRTFSEDFGKLLENLVFTHLKSEQAQLFYFKEKKECDFVIRTGTKITAAIQVCHTLDDFNKEREFKGLQEAIQKFKLSEGTLLTMNQEDEFTIEGKKIIVRPVWKWLLDHSFSTSL
ncbi:MAG: ATP-binding protein [Nanoarchaeota archaeon]